MKKYCLTECAKTKLSKIKETTIMGISIFAAVLFVLLPFIFLTLLLVGSISEAILHVVFNIGYTGTFTDTVAVGGTTVLLSSISVVIFTEIVMPISKSIYASIVEESGYKPTCKIFEECKDD